jgi:hypothetical protein
MTTDADRLARQIDDIAEMIRDAQAFEHQHNMGNVHTRKLPADALRALRRWRTAHTTPTSATLCDKSRATAPRDNGQPTAGDQVHIVCEESPTVPTGPATSVRIPPELREQADALARERRWTFGEVVRVGLEQLVGAPSENTHDAEPRRAA